MGIINLILIVALGLLGVTSWLRAKYPQTSGPLVQLESVGNWVGLAGFLWGLFMLIQLVLNLGALLSVPLSLVIALASALSVTALSLILAAPTIEALIGRNGATVALSKLARDLAAFKLILGVICLVLAAYAILSTL